MRRKRMAGWDALQSDVLDEEGLKRGRSTANEIDLPMCATPSDSIRDARITPKTPEKWGIRGDPRNLDWDAQDPNWGDTEKYEGIGYELEGINVKDCKDAKFRDGKSRIGKDVSHPRAKGGA